MRTAKPAQKGKGPAKKAVQLPKGKFVTASLDSKASNDPKYKVGQKLYFIDQKNDLIRQGKILSSTTVIKADDTDYTYQVKTCRGIEKLEEAEIITDFTQACKTFGVYHTEMLPMVPKVTMVEQ